MLIIFVPFSSTLAEPTETHVIDGDTIAIGDRTIRLFGIDAPELLQRCSTLMGREWDCGAHAKARLEALVAGQAVTCRTTDYDQYGREIAVCFTNEDLGHVLVRSGLAWAYTQFSDAYRSAEMVARLQMLGVWSGRNEPPWEFRDKKRTEPADEA